MLKKDKMENGKTYIIFDLEATCYNNRDTSETKPRGFKNEIIEIGAVKVDDKGNVLDEFSKFLKPLKFQKVSKFCTELTTITQDDIDYADDAKDVLTDFIEWMGDSVLVSWGVYDKRQLRQDLKINGLDKELVNDTNHRSLKHEYAVFNGLRKKGIGLGGAIKREGLTFQGTAHRGIDDAKNILRIFRLYLDLL